MRNGRSVVQLFHRDIKLGNIVLVEQDRFYVVKFIDLDTLCSIKSGEVG